MLNSAGRRLAKVSLKFTASRPVLWDDPSLQVTMSTLLEAIFATVSTRDASNYGRLSRRRREPTFDNPEGARGARGETLRVIRESAGSFPAANAPILGILDTGAAPLPKTVRNDSYDDGAPVHEVKHSLEQLPAPAPIAS